MPLCPVCAGPVARRGARGPAPTHCSPRCKNEARNARRSRLPHQALVPWDLAALAALLEVARGIVAGPLGRWNGTGPSGRRPDVEHLDPLRARDVPLQDVPATGVVTVGLSGRLQVGAAPAPLLLDPIQGLGVRDLDGEAPGLLDGDVPALGCPVRAGREPGDEGRPARARLSWPGGVDAACLEHARAPGVGGEVEQAHLARPLASRCSRRPEPPDSERRLASDELSLSWPDDRLLIFATGKTKNVLHVAL